METIIKIDSLFKEIDNRPILQDISFEVKKGEIFTIIGGSGSGKTSITKHIIGFWKPTKGNILVKDKNVAQLSREELNELRKSIGYVFQEGALFDSLKVWQNIGFYSLEHTNESPEKIKNLVIEKLKLLNLDDSIIELYPSELSGGMKKRVSIARAIFNSPEIIIYDEPTSGLDPLTSRVIDSLILDLKLKLNITSILVTHDMVSALSLSDKILLLDKGKTAFLGTKEEFLRSNNELVKSFIKNSTWNVNV